jgi:hypothetical protein
VHARAVEASAEGIDTQFSQAVGPRFPTPVKGEVERSGNCDRVVINTDHMNEAV